MRRRRVYDDVTQTTFDTPTVELRRTIPPGGARAFLKLEFFNPLSGLKDRTTRAMIEAAEHSGELTPTKKIVEATGGAEGLGLALVAAARGYELTLASPEGLSEERQKTLRSLGAKLILTPKKNGMNGALRVVREMRRDDPNVWVPNLFENPANTAIHEATTGPEIWRDLGGRIDVFIAGVGSGGTFVGVSRYLRRKNPQIITIAVEPAESPVLSGGKPGEHGIVGIGAGFVPKIFDRRLASGVETATTEEAFYWRRRLAREEGILAGISTGANLAVASRFAARRENKGKIVVTLAPDGGERYLALDSFDSFDDE